MECWPRLTTCSNGAVITSTSDFQTFWHNVASHFAWNERVIFDTSESNHSHRLVSPTDCCTDKEYHDMDQTLVFNLNQAAINGIRDAGATSQYVFVEGNSWSGAWTWAQVNDNMKALSDPQNKIVYEMHQYLDSDGSGTSEMCVSPTIGKERITSATQWLKENGKVGILGEFAGGVNDQCKTAISGMLSHMAENSNVWMGAIWWAAGPWWGSYMYSMEPSSGTAYSGMMSALQPYLK